MLPRRYPPTKKQTNKQTNNNKIKKSQNYFRDLLKGVLFVTAGFYNLLYWVSAILTASCVSLSFWLSCAILKSEYEYKPRKE